MCGTRKRLDVHHLNYKNIHDVTVDDLQVLCRKCHNKEHGHVDVAKPNASLHKANKPKKHNRHSKKHKLKKATSLIDSKYKLNRQTSASWLNTRPKKKPKKIPIEMSHQCWVNRPPDKSVKPTKKHPASRIMSLFKE